VSFLPLPRQAVVLVILLLVAIGVFYGTPPERRIRLDGSLSKLRTEIPGWQLLHEGAVEPEVQNVLRADETLVRDYVSTNGAERASLFIAFFGSQATGAAPHSPKNCLPGSGWTASQSDIIQISVPGESEPIPVNRYIVGKGETRALVLYWYQSHRRVVASEYRAKLYLVYDSIRDRRSDTSIVRVIVPITGDAGRAEQTAIGLVQAAFQPIRAVLPH